MFASQIVRGIGQGSIFGYGRFLGVHNPLDTAIGKAADPYINMRRVVLSSNSSDPCVRAAVTDTLKAKIEHGFDIKHLAAIDRTAMVSALSKADLIGHRLNIPLRGAFLVGVRQFVAGCSIDELGILSNSDNSIVFDAMQEAAMPHIQEIIQTSIARHLAIFTPKKSVKEILPHFKDSLPDHHVCYVRQGIDGIMGFLSKAHHKDSPEETWTRDQILRELSEINPVLAGLIISRFEQMKD